MGVSLKEHQISEPILEEASLLTIAMVKAFTEINLGEFSRGRPMLRLKDAFKRGVKAWHMREKWATAMVKWKCLCKTRNTPHL